MHRPQRPSTRRTAAAYDEAAADYRDWWAPVIADEARAVLDRVPDSPGSVLDIGTGSGVLALAALRRWPATRVIGIDPSAGILALAAEAAAHAGVADRLDLRRGDGLDLPLSDASVDAVVSSFAIQLTASRRRFLAEAARVARPGATVAIVSWQATDHAFAPADALEDAFDEVDAPEPRMGPEPRVWPMPAVARRELRAAGLLDVRAEVRTITHRFTAASYLDLAEHWIADDVFGAMTERERERLRRVLVRRLRPLSPEELTWRPPTVVAWGRR